ncbi:MAG: protein translocase subunit SecF [Pseudomonadales bacterium]|nr:protein translocase subunit SecF [Pseudomonadales bacterium]
MASVIMVLVSILSLAVNSLNFGLDFTSGTLVDVAYPQTADIPAIRTSLTEAGYAEAVVVPYGSDREVLVRVPSPEGVEDRDASAIGDEIMQVLQANSTGELVLRSSEFVSPQVGEELAESGGMGLLVALGIVMMYVAVRFQFKFSVGAVVALIHDVLVILGLFSLFQVTFDLTVLAALLAVIGYSLNDTIVVADRIRENFRILRTGTPAEMINISLNQVLSRTIITSFTTLLVLFAMLLVGGDAIRGFAEALIMGITVGTYSSIYVVTNVLLYMGVSKEDLMVPVKEGVDQDSMP